MSRLLASQVKTLGDNYKLTPATLAHRLNPNWIPAPHLLYISLQIAKAIRKGNARILISVPPRHGKSELITKYTTVWGLEHFPMWNYILATYGAELSTDFGREVRDIIQGNEDLLSVRIRKDAARTANWKTPEGGGMAAVGVGGAITGRGANVLLIDDYIKEIKEALSKSYKDYLWNWLTTVALTRLEPGGSVIIIATRWAPDDLHGRIIKYNPGGRWVHIKIPAIAMENDLLGRHPGEALFPERYNEEALAEKKETLGSFFFNALYQQEPKEDKGDITDVSWLKIVDHLPALSNMVQARIWDLAATQGGGDYTAGSHMVHDRNNNQDYITNVIRERLSSQQVEHLVRQTAIADGTETTIYIEQEPGSSGKALVEHYQNNVLPEFKVEAVPSNDGKLTRAQPFLAAAEAGKVHLLKGKWNEAFLDEFKDFPGGDHDDQIDTCAIGYMKLSGKKTFSASWGRGRNLVAQGTQYKQTDSGLIIPKKSGIIFGRNR
jgi:predicted phage terminase large subunit-like protein